MSGPAHHLARLLAQGPRPLSELLPELGLSRHAVGRLVRGQPDRFLRIGARKTARYALTRAIPGVVSPIPVHEWAAAGQQAPVHLLDLVPIAPQGFAVLPATGGLLTATDGLPWFLQDHRPQGFLGRQIPRLYPELQAPDDIRSWSDDHVIRYATTMGSSPPGALVVGHAPLFMARHFTAPGPEAPSVTALLSQLTQRVLDGLLAPTAGSSAAGEQPKLLATLTRPGARIELVVKYSPPLHTAVGRRVGDLLVAEHLAGQTIHAHRPGWAAPSTVHLHADRMWLLSERFDRTPTGGRLGACSLLAVDGEHTGVFPRQWSRAAAALVGRGLLSATDAARIDWLEAFGHGIGNTDMHFGNLTLGLRGIAIDGVRPIYDMLPMAWMPRHGELTRVTARPRGQSGPATAAVTDFWRAVASHALISKTFQAVARDMAA